MKPVVIKIGGSTIGDHDTSLEDLVTLQKKNIPIVVVHGGAKTVTDWSKRFGISPRIIGGLRVTDIESLKVVTAVLAGLVNKNLVSEICHLGGRAIGISGVDGNLIKAKNITPELEYTGEELHIDISIIQMLLEKDYIPVVAPVSFGMYDSSSETRLINVNADAVAAEIAAGLDADKLIFLTDVPGLYDKDKKIIDYISPNEAEKLVNSGSVSDGMMAKIKASLEALAKVSVTRIIDGRVPHALHNEIEGKGGGTTIAW
jgi:acetylglutamate kinase